MALLKCKISHFARLGVRTFSSINSVKEKDIKKSVFISQSNDIYTNLALEEWMSKNFDFKNHHVLLLSRNEPCIVIGKNQNPWLESNVCNLSYIGENGVQLARRQSCGNTIYNDQGNLNMTFFTPSERYNDKYNLDIIKRAIFRKYAVKIDASSTDYLSIYNKNVSFSLFIESILIFK